MANLFVSYDLYNPGQNYEAVISTIKGLGSWAKVQKSLWYLKTSYSYEHVAKTVWGVMDKNDSLIVIDTTNNTAYWYGLGDEVTNYLQGSWHR